MAYVSPFADTLPEDQIPELPIEQSDPMDSFEMDDRAIAIQNWPKYGDYAYNNSQLFQPYWLQFEEPSTPVMLGFGAFVAIVGVLSVVGNGLVCFTFLR